MHYHETTQATKWQLSSQNELNSLREHANRRAREWLALGSGQIEDGGGDEQQLTSVPFQVFGFAATRGERLSLTTAEAQDVPVVADESSPSYGPTHNAINQPLLNPTDECLLLSFYASKIPNLIGPRATLPRCVRAPKVAATACLLFKRFYLSNSVMMYDPKCMSVAAAFLASKVEDCMLDVRYLELATKEMNAPVGMDDILKAEVQLLKGCDFDLLMFHPYKTVLACTEDLRVVGEDLRPMHNAAMEICDDVIVSDIPLMYGPGEIGLAALMVANDYVCEEPIADNEEQTILSKHTKIDMIGYIQTRFQDSTNELHVKIDSTAIESLVARVTILSSKIRELKEGKHGCGNHNVDMESLKGVHKKLKKCRAWGQDSSGSKKKKKKRKADE
ncbi:hypothetical protein HJC23_011526 [Cyclotella cryptica]|uniref:Cyclin N-terminal domain-containing protein n=1 Tax=Cyclotella cryptica TaxID=29204 RepID=A0ABD3PTW3_9STRA